MVQPQTILNVVDNSGVKQIKCIEVRGRSKRGVGFQGDCIVACIVSFRKKNTTEKRKSKLSVRAKTSWKKGTIVQAVIVRTNKNKSQTQGKNKKTGIYFNFPNQNAAVLLTSNKKDPLATRITGGLPSNLRVKGYLKVLSIGGWII